MIRRAFFAVLAGLFALARKPNPWKLETPFVKTPPPSLTMYDDLENSRKRDWDFMSGTEWASEQKRLIELQRKVMKKPKPKAEPFGLWPIKWMTKEELMKRYPPKPDIRGK